MKKIIALILSLVMLLSLAACAEAPAATSSDSEPSDTKPSQAPIIPEDVFYKVTYEGGEGATGDGPADKEVEEGEEVMLPDVGFEKEGYIFAGWSDGESIYQMADFYVVEQDVTFTATWTAIPTLIDLGNMDSVNGWEGFPPASISTDNPAEGTGFLTITAGDAIVYRNISTTHDFSYLMEKGVVHISIYVEDPGAITGGQIEFSSSGGGDVNEISVGEFGTGLALQAGWNTFEIPLSQFGEVGGALNVKAVNYVRVYFLTNAAVKTGIDDFYIYIPE